MRSFMIGVLASGVIALALFGVLVSLGYLPYVGQRVIVLQ